MAQPTPTPPNDKDERYRRVWDVVSGIPYGCVLNYGEIARLAGLPGRARMVGRALGLAPRSMQLPWHRVVNAQGRISFKPGGAKYRRQRELLEAEGVSAAKALVIDDMEDNLAAARDIGARTALVSAKEPREPWDFHAASFPELCRQILQAEVR